MRRARLRVLGAVAGALAGLSALPVWAAPRVVVTIKPLHALVAQVMAGIGSPELLVRGAASPHNYALRPSETRMLHDAQVFVRMSQTLEPFTIKLVRSLPDTVEVVTLLEVPRLTLLSRRTQATFEQHSHDGKPHSHRAHGTSGPDALDGHAWLDPDNAAVMVERIGEVLGERDPANAAAYKANAEALKSRLAALASDLGRELRPIAGRPYVVFHDAYQYLERRYGLNAVGSISVSPDAPASAKRLTELRARIVALGAVCVFAEPQIDMRLVENLIEGTKARAGTLDPEGTRLEPGPELYFTLMRRLASDLKGCLAPPAHTPAPVGVNG
ncbi:MAG TPA: zinc ABC transporter substrate-binding protein [Hyphomicrobiaceae bacterium]|nr:zinc ABC transporter substrate-binding protein [Hyphomicrobiaceae bacterium]